MSDAVSPVIDRPSIGSRSPSSRSAIANRSRMFPKGVDARSASARRLRDLIFEFAKPLGSYECLSEADAVLVREVAAKTVEAEVAQSALARGLAVDSEQSVRVSNVLARLLAQLERRRKALATPTPVSPLADYLANLAAKAEPAEPPEPNCGAA